MKHKHADVLIAIAEGKDVQWMNPVVGIWFDALFYNPINDYEFEWRIKPEPKPDLVKYLGVTQTRTSPLFDCPTSLSNYCWDNQVKLTFDGENGELKKAEVIS